MLCSLLKHVKIKEKKHVPILKLQFELLITINSPINGQFSMKKKNLASAFLNGDSHTLEEVKLSNRYSLLNSVILLL